MTAPISSNRRPLQTRSRRWAHALAAWLARAGFTPNGISTLGLGAAAVGAGAMSAGWWWAAAACVQLRLLCNMLDGLVAVEHGKGDKLGGFFNEVPDRIEDVLLLLGAGLAANSAPTEYGILGPGFGATLGWAAALLAVSTAYLRQVGGAMGLPQDFSGPLAKPQRMFVLTLTLLAAGLAPRLGAHADSVVCAGLAVIVAGTALTAILRTLRLAAALQKR